MSQPAQSTVSNTPVNRWVQLTACIFAMAAIANLQYAWTLFTIPLAESLQASLIAIQVTFTLFVLAETWLVPVEGYLIDRYGARVVVAIGGVLVGLGWVGAGYANSLTSLYVWYTLGGAGAGAVYGASIGTALKWFPDRRGFAAGLAAGAFGFGTALTIIPIQNMIDSSGYRQAFIVWGVIQGVIVILAAMVLSKPPKGWKPEGWAGPASAGSAVTQSLRSYTPLEMVRTGSFWLLYAMMAMVAFGGLMVAAQLKPIAAIYGMDKSLVAFGMTALTLALFLDRIVNGLTRPLWGWISDHIGRYNAMGISFFLEAFGILALIMLIDRPIWFVILSGFVFFAWGNIYSLFPAAIGDLFGPEYATTNYGIQYTAKGTASIFAGAGAVWLVEMTGSWTPVFYTAAVCDFLAAALAFLWLKPHVARLAARKTSVPQATATATATS
jgi:MFS transporter, OFA family, oxalate/formate antiporter